MQKFIKGLALSLVAVGGVMLAPATASANMVGPVYPTAATYVSSAHPNSNYGTATRLWAQNDTEQNYVLLKFDLNSVHDEADRYLCDGWNNGEAQLFMKVDEVSTGGHEVYMGDNTAWTETGVKWNNMPGILSQNPYALDTIASSFEDSVNDWTEVNMFGSVWDACDYTDGLLTVIIKGGSTNAVAWKSNDASSEVPYAYFDIGD